MRGPRLLALSLALAGCARGAVPRSAAVEGPVAVLELCLEGPLASRHVEYSGLAWRGDELVLLPQNGPRGMARLAGEGLFVATVPRARIERWVDGSDRSPIAPTRVPIDAGALPQRPGWQGFEAMAFASPTRGVLVAELGEGDHMSGLLVPFTWDERGLRVDGDPRELPVPARSDNHAFEAVTEVGGGWLAVFEANGVNASCGATALLVPSGGGEGRPVPFPSVPYRVTDATTLDADGGFWMPQYSYRSANDTECERTVAARSCFGGESVGCEHPDGGMSSFERLIELRYRPDGVTPTGRAITLERDARPRNWEGIARLGDAGFVVVTDEWPRSVLGFVRAPGRSAPRPAPRCEPPPAG